MCVFSAERLCDLISLLVNEMAQLESLIRDNKYHDIVHAYGVRVSPPVASIGALAPNMIQQAVKQLSLTFKPYTAVPTIAQVWRKVQDIQGELRTKVDADFDALCVGRNSPVESGFNQC